MREKRLSIATICILAGTLFAACGSQGGSGYFDENQKEGASSSGTVGGLGGGATPNCSDKSAGDLHGCGCNEASRACWTVPNEIHNTSGCKDGVQTCQKTGEFSSWSACTGEVTSCADNGGSSSSGSSGNPGSDGGTGDGTDAGKGGPPGCVCVPGAVRWCDTPIACNWGKQQCKPDGQWGSCNETPDRPAGCNDPIDPSYDQDCCVRAGQCCQDFMGLFDDKSVGKCDNIACPGG
jgi:hypothetical protein